MKTRPQPPTYRKSQRIVHSLPTNEIEIPAPPHAPNEPKNGIWLSLLPILLMVGIMVVIGLLRPGMSSFLFLSVPLMAASGFASVFAYRHQKKQVRKEREERIVKYTALLNRIEEEELDTIIKEQYTIHSKADPNPQDCLHNVQTRSRILWSRSRDDSDFLCPRMGLGTRASTVEVKAPDIQNHIDPDPLILAARELASRFAEVETVPICLNIPNAGVCGVAGGNEELLNAATALTIQVATHHAPSEVKIAALFPVSERDAWTWMRWLPHTWHENRKIRFLASTQHETQQLLKVFDDLVGSRQRSIEDNRLQTQAGEFACAYVVLIARPDLVESNPVIQRIINLGPKLNIYPVFFDKSVKALPPICRTTIRLASVGGGDGGENIFVYQTGVTGKRSFAPDPIPEVLKENFVAAMAPIRFRQAETRSIPDMVTLFDLLDIEELDGATISTLWEQNREPAKTFSVPIGQSMGNDLLNLDLHEKAHGPNGLVAGTVGSGKSELLQTLVASLAFQFPPERISFALVDYKGGGMAQPFADLPHTVGIITNLENSNLAARAIKTFDTELKDRQALLNQQQPLINHIDDYQQLYFEGKVTEPMPYLLVIVDEFAEMKTEQPEVAAEFIRIARVGRALGLRLILAMQKSAGIVSDQIEANTRFRLCLRVAQTEDSQAMLKRPDAAYLAGNGRAFIQVGANEIFREFQAAWGGAPFDPERTDGEDNEAIVEITLSGRGDTLYSPASIRSQYSTDGERVEAADGGTTETIPRTQLQALMQHINKFAEARGITTNSALWQPPLSEQLFLEAVAVDENSPLSTEQSILPIWQETIWHTDDGNALVIPIGMVDEVSTRRHKPLELNLAQGHLAIYGAPSSGKTTLLQSIITSLSNRYSPKNVNIYVLDFGGNTLNSIFQELPHVGSIIGLSDIERILRLLLTIRNIIDERKQSEGQMQTAIVVMIDNYANVRELSERHESIYRDIVRIAQDGLSVGVHLIVTANSVNAIRSDVANNIEQAIALNLVEHHDYSTIIGREAKEFVLSGLPGRGLVRSKPPLECQIALPILGDTDVDRSKLLRNRSEQMKQVWGERPHAPEIRHLQDEISLNSLLPTLAVDSPSLNGSRKGRDLSQNTVTEGVIIGVNHDDLLPTRLNLADGPHFLVTGTVLSGKSTLMRTIAHSLCHHYEKDALKLVVWDSGRLDLAPLQHLEHTVCYCDDEAKKSEFVTALNDLKTVNKNGTSDELKQVVVFVDNFTGETPIDAELSEIIRNPQQINISVIVAVKLGEANSMYSNSTLKTLKELYSGFVLGIAENPVFRVDIPYREREKPLPPGEAYMISRRGNRKIKVAMVESTIPTNR